MLTSGMTPDERSGILVSLNSAIRDLEYGVMSQGECVFLVGLLISLRDVSGDPFLVARREKAKALVWELFDDTPALDEALPYLDQMDSQPVDCVMH